MVRPTLARLARLLGLVWLALFALTPSVRAADLTVTADFDGDGRTDHALLDRQEPSLIRVWLSRTGRTATVRTRTAVAAIVAADLDGDRKAELVTRGASTDLQVWTKSQRGFRSYRARDRVAVVHGGHHHSASENPEPSDPDVSVHTVAAAALVPNARPRAPVLPVVPAIQAEALASDSSAPSGPFAPRPPPASPQL